MPIEQIKEEIDTMNVFDLQELARHLSLKMKSIGAPPTILSESVTALKQGDLIEFFSSKASRTLRCTVDRVNPKTISCTTVDIPSATWRVSRSLVRLVGTDRPTKSLASDDSVVEAQAGTDLPDTTGCAHAPTVEGEDVGSW